MDFEAVLFGACAFGVVYLGWLFDELNTNYIVIGVHYIISIIT